MRLAVSTISFYLSTELNLTEPLSPQQSLRIGGRTATYLLVDLVPLVDRSQLLNDHGLSLGIERSHRTLVSLVYIICIEPYLVCENIMTK